jgi:RimJ/RimL family protein N-acetyltransferase
VGPRVVLRPETAIDVAQLGAVVSRNLEHLRPWMPWVANEPLTDEQRLALLERWDRERVQGGDAVFGIFLDGEIVGGAGLHRRRGPHGLEIGYWVDRDHLGRGIATEAAGLLTEAALGVPGITFVEIHHDKANVASAKVPERLGYRFVGEAPDQIKAPGEVGIDCTWRKGGP